MRNKGHQEYSLLTVNGRVVLRRICRHSPETGSLTPLDQYLDEAERTVSLGVREMACLLNGNSSNFERTAESLQRAGQIETSGETLRKLIEDEGRKVIAAGRAGTLPISWSAADCRSDPKDARSPTRMYFGSDGVMAPVVTDPEKKSRREKIKLKRRKNGKKCRPLPRAKEEADGVYKEFKIVTHYDETKKHRVVVGTKGSCEEAGRMMRRLGEAIHLSEAAEKIGIVDGAPWIRNQIERQNLYLDAVGLDFFHLSEQVHKARRVVFGEDDEAGRAWADALLHDFKHLGYAASREKIGTWRGSLRGGKRAAADSLLNDVTDRREMIAYPEFIEKGWQIGSGPTEAACKTLTMRLKGAGMRWAPTNAEAIMALVALHQSGLWKDYWRSLLPQKT